MRVVRHIYAHALAARIAERDRPFVMSRSRGHHTTQLCLVGGGHHNHSGQVRQKSHIKTAGMGRPVRTDQACAIDRKPDGQTLDGNVMHDLVITPLQEGRVKRAKGFQSACSHSSRKSHSVLFCNAHVKTSAWVAVQKSVKPGAVGHGGCYGHNFFIARGMLDQRFGKHLCIAWCITGRLGLFARGHVEFGPRMASVRGPFGRRKAFALLGDRMHQNWARGTVFDGP